MSIDRLGVGLHYGRRVKTPRREFEHRRHLFPRDVKPVHHLADSRSRFQIVEHYGNGRSGVPEYPSAATLAGNALHGRAV